MKEILGVTEEPRTRRRWFHDERFDLFVWQAEGGELVSFQLCYGTGQDEQALVWHKESGFFRDGERASLETDEKWAAAMIAHFDAAAADLPADIRPRVTALFREYARRQPVTARRKRFRRAEWQKAEPRTR